MAPKVIPIAGPKDRANLEVSLVDRTTKAPADAKVEVWAHRAPTDTKKGKVLFTQLGLTSGSAANGDFFDGWVLKVFGPSGILKWPIPDSDKVVKPKGGALHKLTIEIDAPTAALIVTVTEGGKPLAGVEVEAHTKAKTGADGKATVQAPIGAGKVVHARLKGKALKVEGAAKAEADDLAFKVDVAAAGSAATVVVEALAAKGIVGTLPGTRSVRTPGLTRGPSVLRSGPGVADHDGSANLDKNKPFVLVRGAGTVTLVVEANADRPKATWALERRDADPAKPKPKAIEVDGGRELTVTADVEGAFNVTASLDLKTFVVWALDIVSVVVDVTTSRRILGQSSVIVRREGENQTESKGSHDKTKNNGVLAVQAGQFRSGGAPTKLSSQTPPQPPSDLDLAVFLAVRVRLQGPPGAERRVLVTILQNGTLSDAQGIYEKGKGTVREVGLDGKAVDSAKGVPVLDANGSEAGNLAFKTLQYPWMPPTWPGPWADKDKTFPPFIWVKSSFAVSDPFSTERWVQTLDCPEVVFPNRHRNLPNGTFDSPYLTAFKGGCRFRTAIASVSLDAPETILAHADLLWNVDYGGDVAMPGGLDKPTALPEYTRTTAECRSDSFRFQPITADGSGIDAAAAGMETFDPRFSKVKEAWTP